ncbi:MAG: extracellular solute-binding protein [Chloroflexota bacterium]|nr:extracellular solute-binding protein [Chloroflexota bacterium]
MTIWGPPELSPGETPAGSELLAEEYAAFERFYPDIQLHYEPRAMSGPASLLNYLRSASSVAPSILPDLVIIPPSLLEEAAQTGLLFPLDGVIPEGLRTDLYPFATRDTQVAGNWLALPLALKVEHGATRTGQQNQVPQTLDRLLRPNAPTWLFAGQAGENGEMTNVLLLQLLAISEQMPAPGSLPEQEELVALLATLQAAQQEGVIPRQNLLISDETLLFNRLISGQAGFIETSSRTYLMQQRDMPDLTFTPIPTLNGTMPTVVDGYLIALATNDPRQQQAAARYLEWFFDPARLAAWSGASAWLPARRSTLEEIIDDEEYGDFLDALLEQGWLRQGGATWSSFAQAMQEQFRAVMTEATSPVEAVDAIIETYGATP